MNALGQSPLGEDMAALTNKPDSAATNSTAQLDWLIPEPLRGG